MSTATAELEATTSAVINHAFGIPESVLQRLTEGIALSFSPNLPSRMSLGPQTVKQTIPDKPSADMLKVMQSPELATGDSRQALAVQVEDLLGYTPLRKDAGAPSRLQRVLQELQIEAFDQGTVNDYKRRMRAHFQAKANEREGIDPERLSRLTFAESMYYTRPVVAWDRFALSEYSKPVPEFVLRKCVQIKQQAPDAEFFVDELREHQVTLDPFLFVKIGEDTAAIEVWDEPEFEKTL